MKKISLYLSLAIAGLFTTACHEDFDDWAQPQSFAEPTAISIPGFTATAVANDIDLNDDATEVKVLNFSGAQLPEGATIGGLRMDVVPADDADRAPVTMEGVSSAEGTFSKADLQDFVVSVYGPRPTARTLKAHVYADGIVNGQAALVDAGTININVIPEAPYIAPNYYIVGGSKGWDSSKDQKFSHSSLDVYEDPVFTIIIDAAAEGDTWFAIGDDEGVEAIAEGVWNKLFGIVGGDSQSTAGSIDYRYNLGGDNSFCVPAGAKKIKVVINMMDRTFTVTPVSISDNYYLIGGPGNWDNSKNQKFSHSDKDIFDDPVFTYVFESTGGEMWFAFGDDDAIDAVGAGTWNRLFGTTGDSKDLSGSFERRYNLDGDHSFCVDGQAKYYRFSVNMMTSEYTITPLNFSEYLWEAGVNNDWGAIEQPLYCANQDGIYTGFFYAQDADWSAGMGAFKFTGAFNDWSQGNYGAGSSTDAGGTMINDGGSGNLLATPGFYRADVNLADMTYTLTRINSIFVVGSAVNNDWDTGVEMTYNLAERCWECTTTLNEGQIKFKGNGTWDNLDGNWGGTLDNVINGSNDNIDAPVTGKVTIKFYPRCDTKSYATVTAAE